MSTVDVVIVGRHSIDEDNTKLYIDVTFPPEDGSIYKIPIQGQYVMSANAFHIDSVCREYLDHMGFEMYEDEIIEAVENR